MAGASENFSLRRYRQVFTNWPRHVSPAQSSLRACDKLELSESAIDSEMLRGNRETKKKQRCLTTNRRSV